METIFHVLSGHFGCHGNKIMVVNYGKLGAYYLNKPVNRFAHTCISKTPRSYVSFVLHKFCFSCFTIYTISLCVISGNVYQYSMGTNINAMQYCKSGTADTGLKLHNIILQIFLVFIFSPIKTPLL